jgi:hypothetical protein
MGWKRRAAFGDPWFAIPLGLFGLAISIVATTGFATIVARALQPTFESARFDVPGKFVGALKPRRYFVVRQPPMENRRKMPSEPPFTAPNITISNPDGSRVQVRPYDGKPLSDNPNSRTWIVASFRPTRTESLTITVNGKNDEQFQVFSDFDDAGVPGWFSMLHTTARLLLLAALVTPFPLWLVQRRRKQRQKATYPGTPPGPV